jgi:hypothetical protein
MKRSGILVLVAIVALAALVAAEEERRSSDLPRKGRTGLVVPPASVMPIEALSIIVGRPTDKSVTVNVLSAETREAYIEYGQATGNYSGKTGIVKLPAGTPVEVPLDGLERDRRYFYRLQHRMAGSAAFTAGAEQSLQTQRAPGSTFTFEIQGDSHPERPHQFDASLYARTLRSAADDRPDFYMTMGDDFSVDDLRTVSAATVDGAYRSQRLFLGLVGQTAPLFLVNGNHEQAAACNLDGTSNNVAVWAQTSRNRHFPQPAPDGFYTGNDKPIEHIGLLRDYYAWRWGDALFAVIDPYWHSPVPVDNVYGGGEKSRDRWAITLGDAQYRWFKRMLEESDARHKFVFSHHVLGTGRGGIENAGLYEWGGKNKRGDGEFGQNRPGWELPIHQLMAKNGVTIFFQGHDHIFARQELDGVVYQTLPEPADASYALYFRDAYRTGDVLPNSGRLRVTVSPVTVDVEYIRSWLPGDETAEHRDGEVAFRYSVPSKKEAQ